MSLTRTQCLEDCAYALDNISTRFNMSAFDYAENAARNSFSLFISRWGNNLGYLPLEQQKEAKELWASVLLAPLMQFAGWSYEQAADRYGPAIANNMYLLTPDMRVPLYERTYRHLNLIGSATDGIKVAVMTTAAATIKVLGSQVEKVPTTALWELATYTRQLQAPTLWSKEAWHQWKVSADIVNTWYRSGQVSWNTAKPYIDWSLNNTIKVNDMKAVLSD